MAATLTHLDGSMSAAAEDELPALLRELAEADAEHTDVSVSDEAGWTLSVFRDGRVVWENVEEGGEPRHLRGVPEREVLDLLRALVRGDLDPIEQRAWEPGY
jgi:hypothetical protein